MTELITMIYYAYDLNHSYLHALKHAYILCANIMRAPSSMLPGCSSKFLVNQTLRRLTSTTESCHCPQRCALSEGIADAVGCTTNPSLK